MRTLLMAVAALVLVGGLLTGSGNRPAYQGADRHRYPRQGQQLLDVDMATTDESRPQGPECSAQTRRQRRACCFDFGKEDYRPFWMHNTPLALDMVFIKADGNDFHQSPRNAGFLTRETPEPSERAGPGGAGINGGRARAPGHRAGRNRSRQDLRKRT